MTPRGRALFYILFFLSGAAGLIYEVCWMRLLRLPMGNTLYSVTTVLTAFMGGLALGSYLAGRRIDRGGHPLRVYALLEAAIGVFCLALAWIVRAEEPLFRWIYRDLADSVFWFHLSRFAACAVVVLIPATLMGATLPVLCRYFVNEAGRVGRSIGWLYAVNALGAAAGSLLAGFFLVPRLGQQGAILTGVATSLAVAAIAWFAQSRLPDRPPPIARAGSRRTASVSTSSPASGALRRVLIVGYGLSGLASMVFQVAWSRVLSLTLGSSVYAFALLVSAIILGLALGSGIAARVADRVRRPALAFALLELGIGFTALAMVPVFQRFPEWMLHIVPAAGLDFGRFQFVQFGLVFAALLLPTACMGACLPLVGRALMRGLEHAAETVASAYSANAVGTIVGAFVGGFVLLPRFGMHHAIQFGAAVNLMLGIVLLVLVLPRRVRWPAAALAGAGALAAIVLAPRFDPNTFTSGAYLYADRLAQSVGGQRDLEQLMRDEYRILMHREGLMSTITVKEAKSGARALFVNGKMDASDGIDMPTQVLCGHIAGLLHPSPHDVAVIGLASGVTLNALASHPGVRSLDCIEIAPEMVQACRLFDHVNGRILDDPRVHVIFQDGRNHLKLTNREYDIIVSEPSNPWISGIASLYTREFLQACRDRLRPNGIMGVWVHLYGLDLHALRSQMRTFLEVFPEASLWETVFGTDYHFIGVKGQMSGSWEELARRMAEPAVRADLERVGVRGPADLLVRHVADAAGMRAFAATGEVYTDDRNRLEFEAPRLMHRVTTLEDLNAIQESRHPGPPSWLRMPAGGEEAAALESAQAAHHLFWQGIVRKMSGDDPGATQCFLTALEGNRNLREVWPQLLATSQPLVHAMLATGDTAQAQALYARMLALEPTLADIYSEMGALQASTGRLDDAESAFRRALELRPRSTSVLLNLANVLVRQNRNPEAESCLRRILELRPDHWRARLELGQMLLLRSEPLAAQQEFETVVRDHPELAGGWYLLGESLRLQGSYAEAAKAYETAVARDPELRDAHRRLAECYHQLGDDKKAAMAAARAGLAR